MIKHHILTIAVRIIFSVIFLSSTIGYADDEPLLTFNGQTTVRSVVYDDQTNVVIPHHDEVTTNLIMAYKIGQQFGFGETLQAIMLQESSGASGQIGNSKAKIANRSYGLMQLQLVTVKDILSRYTELMEKYFPGRLFSSLKNKELITLIMKNSEANITIAAYHLRLYMQLVDNNWNRAIAAYNVGIGNVKHIKRAYQFKYVVGVKQKLNDIVKPFNEQNINLLTQEA